VSLKERNELKARNELKGLCGMFCSIETERQLLGGLLLDNDGWGQVSGKVFAEDFYDEVYGRVFQYIAGLAKRNVPFDQLDLIDLEFGSKAIDQVGTPRFRVESHRIWSITEGVVSAVNLERYASKVRQYSICRQLLNSCYEFSEATARLKGKVLNRQRNQVKKIVNLIEGGDCIEGLKPIKNILSMPTNEGFDINENEGELKRLSTGFASLDRVFELQPGSLIILASRPSVGNSTLAMNLVENIGINGGEAVAVFSMEGGQLATSYRREVGMKSLAMKMACSMAHIAQQKLCTGQFDEDDSSNMQSAINSLADSKIFIDGTLGLTVFQISERCRLLMKQQGQLALIVVDNLELIKPVHEKGKRAEEVSDMTRSLKALSEELDVPIILLSQLNRDLEEREDKRPIMSDLLESDSVEPNVDVIAFVYRDEIYNEKAVEKGVAEIIIGKRLTGTFEACKLAYSSKYARFENFSEA